MNAKRSKKRRIQNNNENVTAPPRQGLILGGFWRRVVAGLLDLVMTAPVAVLGFVFWARMLWIEFPGSKGELFYWLLNVPFSDDPMLVPGIFFGFLMGLTALYFYTSVWGASPGQRIMRLRVVDGAGRRVGPVRGAFRTLGLMLSLGYLFLGVLWIGFDRLRQGWHDKLAGTYVVKTERSEYLNDLSGLTR